MEIDCIEFVPDLGQDMLDFTKHTQLYSALTAIRSDILSGGMSRDTALGLESACPGILQGHRPTSFTEQGSKTKLIVAVEAIDWKRSTLFAGALIIVLGILFKFISWLYDLIFSRPKKGDASYEELTKVSEKLQKETEQRLADIKERHKPMFENKNANRIVDATLTSGDIRITTAAIVVGSLLDAGKIASYSDAERRMTTIQACIMRTRYDNEEQQKLQSKIFAAIAANPVVNFIPGALKLYPEMDRNCQLKLDHNMYQAYHTLMGVLEKIAPSFEGIVDAAKRNDIPNMQMFIMGTKSIGSELGMLVNKHPKMFQVNKINMRTETLGFREYLAGGTELYNNWASYVETMTAAKYSSQSEEITRSMAPLDGAIDIIAAITNHSTYRRMKDFYDEVDRGMKDAAAGSLKDHKSILDNLERTIKTLEKNRTKLLSDTNSPLKTKLSEPEGYTPKPGTISLRFNEPDSGEEALQFLMSLAKSALDLIKPISRAGLGYCVGFEKLVEMLKHQ